MKIPALALCLFGLTALAQSGPEEEHAFKTGLERSRAMMEHHHVICLVDLEPFDGGKANSFRYDHYPTVERLQLKGGATYARKKGKSWLRSDDWAEKARR